MGKGESPTPTSKVPLLLAKPPHKNMQCNGK